MRDDAQVIDAGLSGRDQAMPDAGNVNLDAEKVVVRVFGGQLHERVAVAEADLDGQRGGPSE